MVTQQGRKKRPVHITPLNTIPNHHSSCQYTCFIIILFHSSVQPGKVNFTRLFGAYWAYFCWGTVKLNVWFVLHHLLIAQGYSPLKDLPRNLTGLGEKQTALMAWRRNTVICLPLCLSSIAVSVCSLTEAYLRRRAGRATLNGSPRQLATRLLDEDIIT